MARYKMLEEIPGSQNDRGRLRRDLSGLTRGNRGAATTDRVLLAKDEKAFRRNRSIRRQSLQIGFRQIETEVVRKKQLPDLEA